MGDPSRYTDEIVISWPELHRDARYLSQQLHQLGVWTGIIAITRGGLVPAALVARELEIRLIDTVCVSSYAAGGGGPAQQQSGVQVLKGVAGDGAGYLLIDDLVDMDKTAQVVRQMLPKALARDLILTFTVEQFHSDSNIPNYTYSNTKTAAMLTRSFEF